MPEGEQPPLPSPERARMNLPPSPVTHTDNGFLRRRDDPHGLTIKDRASLGVDRTLKRVDNAIGRIIDPPEATTQIDQEKGRMSAQSNVEAALPGAKGLEAQTTVEEDPLRFGSDVPPMTVRIMRAANRVGEFFQRYFATPLLGEPSNEPLVRRSKYQYSHQMNTQKSNSVPSSVRVVEQKPEPPYDWADRRNGSSEFQDNPIIDTTEAIPTKADESS